MYLQKDEVRIQGTDKILEHDTAYYKELFGPNQELGVKLRSDIWDAGNRLTREEVEQMEIPFDEKKVKLVIDCMEKNKAPGPDGISIEFYHACWPIIKKNLMTIFADFYIHRIDLSRINSRIITLLPKSKDA